MRILLNWAEKGGVSPELKNLMLELKKHSHEIVYWIGHPLAEQDKMPETTFHSYVDATQALPAKGIDPSEFAPLDEDIISKFYKEESIILTMMNRLFDKLCVDESRNIYYGLLRYWLGVIKKYKPEFIIFPTMPHSVYDYIIYIIAKQMNIKTIAFDDTRFPGRLLFFSDFRKGSELFHQQLQDNKGKNFSLKDLSDDIQEYYVPRTSQNYKALPFYIEAQKKKYSTIHWLLTEPKIRESIKNLTIFRKFFVYIYKMFRQHGLSFLKKPIMQVSYIFRNNLKKEYESVQSKADLSKRFIYVPLQVQPERTTCPQGDIFVDQILMLEIISASLPEGWIIYAKEHPIQWVHWGLDFFSSRYKGYYKKIAKIKNVYPVPVKTSSYELINKSQVVSAVTGSANWEAVLRSKPAIAFGYVWYRDCPGIFKANSRESYQKAIKEILQGFKVDQQQIINYLYSFDKATIRGFIANSIGSASKVTKKECMKNITELLLSEMEKYKL